MIVYYDDFKEGMKVKLPAYYPEGVYTVFDNDGSWCLLAPDGVHHYPAYLKSDRDYYELV